MVAEALGRKWIAMESLEDYLMASEFRFDEVEHQQPPKIEEVAEPLTKKPVAKK